MKFFKDFYSVIIAEGRYKYLVKGLGTTLTVSLISLAFAIIFGLLIALVKNAKLRLKPSRKDPKGFFINLLEKIASIFTTIVRGTPSAIQLLIVFNVFMVNVDNLTLVAIVTFTINSSAYMSEVFRGGILAVDEGEVEAASSLGMGYRATMKKIVLPQAFKNALPPFGNEVITLFKETSISGFIGLVDLTRGSAIIVSQTFKAAIPYFTSALIYLVIVIILEKIFKNLEKKNAYAGS